MAEKNRLQLRILHGFVNHKPGDIVTVATVDDGEPRDLYWRRRLKDSAIDGCVEVVKPNSKSKKSADVSVSDGGSK